MSELTWEQQQDIQDYQQYLAEKSWEGKAPEYTDDGMDGYFLGCTIHINQTTNGHYRVTATDNSFFSYKAYAATLETAHALAEVAIIGDESAFVGKKYA